LAKLMMAFALPVQFLKLFTIFLLQCPVFDVLRSTFLDTLSSLGIRQSVTDILSNPCCFDALFSFISAFGRKILISSSYFFLVKLS